MGFAQHQSFYIRANWLPKALMNLNNPEFFSNPENHIKLGIGKNMFSSLKYWAVATGLANKNRKGELEISGLGSLIKQFDPDCIQKDTLAILHYNLCKEGSPAETWNWFFNEFGESSEAKDVLYSEYFLPWIDSQDKKISEKSLKRDFDCLIQFYTVSENRNDPEDTIYSPFSSLALVTETDARGQKKIKKVEGSLSSIGEGALMYTLIEYLQKHQTKMVTIDDVFKKNGLWGKIFNMKKASIAEALNNLSLNRENKLSFIRTNNLDTVVCELSDPLQYLKSYYSKGREWS